ncbi:uncharacterized protein VTP21DRAFT_11006 [Calcarisporiella thermophila]|uniref:uncharacterized protein n=1 Tax=Calcarisporiella thermophila TaxID=911321 RepID=UPI00374325D7
MPRRQTHRSLHVWRYLTIVIVVWLISNPLCSALPESRNPHNLVSETPDNSNITHIKGAGGSFPFSVYSAWTITYNARPYEQVVVSYEAIGSQAGIDAITGPGTVDFAGSEAPLNATHYRNSDDLRMLPTMAGAISIAYNIPELKKAPPIVLSREAIVGIFNGSVMTWSDPLIQSTNHGVHLPNETIRLVVREDGSGTTYMFTSALSAFSPAWAERVGASTLPNWPRKDLRAALNSGIGKFIYALNYSIGYMDDADVQTNGLKRAIVLNRQGLMTWPNKTSIESAMKDFALSASFPPTAIVDGPSPESYPMCGYAYLILHTRNWPDPERMRKALRFLWWTYTDPTAQSILQSYKFVAPISAVTDQVLGLLRTEFTWQGRPLFGRSPCDVGCAHGACEMDGAFQPADVQCQCPIEYTNHRYGNCSEPAQPIVIEYGSPLGLFFIALTLVFLVMVATSLVIIWQYRAHPVVRAASPLFLCLMAAGMLLALTNVFLYLGRLSEFKCRLIPIVLSCSFGLVFG